MLGEGNNPEDATKLFNRAIERIESGQLADAERYFGLSIYYEPRPITYLERAKLLLLMKRSPHRVLDDVQEGLKLCLDNNEHKQVRLDLLSLKSNTIEPLLAAEQLKISKDKHRKANLKAMAQAGDFKGALASAGLSDSIVDLQALSLPALRIKPRKQFDSGIRSKFGGIPDVPAGFIWPKEEEEEEEESTPLEFLCQLDLAEIAKVWSDSNLPSAGLLSFFAAASEFSFGGNPSFWKVFYFDSKSSLKRAKRPSSASTWNNFPNGTFPACSVDFELIHTLPDPYSNRMHAIITQEEDREKYQELIMGWQGDALEDPTHQLLGHPQLIQQDVFDECNEQVEQFDSRFSKQFAKPSQHLQDSVNDWLLLLQIDSDDQAEFFWGDSGKLYFCIRRGDLAARNFDRVVLCGQCF
ncbi:MAG: DUF1963 domain-containing protein [Candidatus Obscuribacterales bacterium]|nr:DUF1963 domain-containing protein [Candidatus Obscuribacterales bacterium]